MKDKVILITGGSSGIGRALAEAFGSKGAKVVITGRNLQTLNETVAALKKSNIEISAIVADASKESDALRMIEETVRIYGGIDVLINNAGITMRAILEDVDLQVIRQVMDINFWGCVYASKFALPHILKSKGSIVGISSIAGKRGLPGRTGYSASKFAMEGFLESLRTEVLHQGVHVLTACPGFTASNIRNSALSKNGNVQGESPRDEEKMMTSEEVAEAIYKAVVKRKRDLVLTSQGIMTVFMNKWLPGMMDKIVYNVMKKERDSPLK
jgi:dehydrogenase/reductase SDR family protein 7B